MKRLLRLIISLGFWALWRIWSWIRKIAGCELPGICIVLHYHAIPSNQRERFARQMDDLVRFAKPLAADNKDPLEKGVNYAVVTFDDGFQSVVDNALPELIKRKIPSTIFIPSDYLGLRPGWNDEAGYLNRKEIVMTADQLQKLPSDFLSIGSHTLTHSRLTLLSEEEAKREVAESLRKLMTLTGRNINLFSFPYGEYNQKLVEWVREIGYERVFTMFPGLAFREPGEYVTNRTWVEPTDWSLEFRLKLLGAYRWLPLASEIKRKTRLMVVKYLGHSRSTGRERKIIRITNNRQETTCNYGGKEIKMKTFGPGYRAEID